MRDVDQIRLTLRPAVRRDDPRVLVTMRDAAARWQVARGIAQWRVGELTEAHFRRRTTVGEVWIAVEAGSGRCAGAWELWWEDPRTWGVQREPAGHVHRLMVDRDVAPPGTGRRLLASAERRILETGRLLARLDCAHHNEGLRAYYRAAGYREVGVCPDSWPSGYPVTLFEKRLGARGEAVLDGGATVVRR